MEYQVKWTSKFKKSYKLAKKRGFDISLLMSVVYKLQHGEQLEERFYDHELKGEYSGFKECHIKPDWLLIYLVEDEVLTLTLIDTGSHSDLYNM